MTAYRELINYTDSFIRDHKKVTSDGYRLDISDFEDDDLEEFAGHLVNYESFEREGWDWIFEDVYREELAGTFAAMITTWRRGEKEELRSALIESLIKSAVKTHRQRMQNWIDDRIGTVEAEDDYERRHPSDPDDWEDAA